MCSFKEKFAFYFIFLFFSISHERQMGVLILKLMGAQHLICIYCTASLRSKELVALVAHVMTDISISWAIRYRYTKAKDTIYTESGKNCHVPNRRTVQIISCILILKTTIIIFRWNVPQFPYGLKLKDTSPFSLEISREHFVQCLQETFL